MTEDKLRLSPNELEGLLIKTCNCVLIGTEGVILNKCNTYIDKIRPFFVSTLERRIYALLDKFVYGEDADRFYEQFPCLKKCIDTTTTLSGPANEYCTKYIGTEIVEHAIKGTIKYLIKEGLFTAFINSVVLNNRINRICRELDALGIEKTFLGYLNVWNFICEKDYWIVNSFQTPRDDPLSDLVVEVGTEDQECLPCKNLKRRACNDPNNEIDSKTETSSAYKIRRDNSNQEISKSSVSHSHKKLGTEHLRLSISKVQFAACGCVDVVRFKKFRRLKLPCKSEDLTRKIFKVDKSLPHSCLMPIRKKFEETVHNICSCLNDVLNRTDSGTIKNLYLVCEVRPGYVSFKLKSIQDPSFGSKPCLFSARVATCRSVFKNQISFRKSLTKENQKKVQKEETSDQNDLGEPNRLAMFRADFPKSQLSDVQEKEEETDEIDTREFENLQDVSNESDPDTTLKRETNSKITVQIRNESNDFETPCSCGQVSTCSRSSFFKIELKLRNVTECFKKSGLKEGESVLKMKDGNQMDFRKRESDNPKGIKEPDLKKQDRKSSPDLQEFEQSKIIFPDSKEAGPSECVWPLKEDQNHLNSKTNVSKIVPNSQEFRKDVKNTAKSQIPIPISSRKKLSQVSTSGQSKPDLGSHYLDSTASKKCETSCSKIPTLMKEELSMLSSSQQSSSSCKTRLRSNEKLKSSLDSLTPKRVLSQRPSKFSRGNLLKKSDHLVHVETPRKCFAPTSRKSFNPSVATLPKTSEKFPKPARRNFFSRPNSATQTQQINIEFPKLHESIRSKTFIKNKTETSLLDVYQRNPEKVPQTTYIIVTDSDEGIDHCDSNCPCQEFISEKTSLTFLQSQNSLDRIIQNLEDSKDPKSCHLRPKIREIGKSTEIHKRNRSNFRTVSVQTVEQKMMSKGINIDIKQTRETLSKAVNVDRRKTSTKGVNVNLIPNDSFISLQTNVTKIISIVDITIFEGEFEKRLKRPLNVCKGLLQVRNTFPQEVSCQPVDNSSGCCTKQEKNPKFHLRSDTIMNSDLCDEICKGIPKIKIRPCNRRHKGGIGDSWATPNKTTKAQNIINAICDPFSNKSINRIKYLIRTKLCRMLLDRDNNDGSKTFVSNERYYVSASSEKTCYSPDQRISSEYSKSENSDICWKERMAGGSDHPIYKCPFRIGSGWEFGGDEDCFLIRKRERISEGRGFMRSKGKELKMPKGKNVGTSKEDTRKAKREDVTTSKEDLRTFKGKDDKRCKRNCSDFGSFPDPIIQNKLKTKEKDQKKPIKREDRNKTRGKNMSPGDVITSCHLGRRHEKALRKRSFNNCSCHESDKENGEKEPKRRSNFQKERGQLLLKEMLRIRSKSRVCSGSESPDESFCDLDQNVRSKLSEYVNLCKSAKYLLINGSDDVYRVSSTSIPFSERGEFRRP